MCVTLPARSMGSWPIDPIFLEVCEPDSLMVTGHSADVPCAVALIIKGDQLVAVPEKVLGIPMHLKVRISGVRKGMTQRFREYTLEQAQKSWRFWDSWR